MRRHAPTLILALFAVILLSPLLVGGEVFYFRDFGRYYAPVKSVCLDRMLHGEFPLWMPELNCGTPVHGELVHSLTYPGTALLFLGETTGWGLYFALHIFLAGLGARALARRFGAGEMGALAAGIAFAGSGYMVGQMNHVPYVTAAAWMPLVILMGLRAGDGARGATPLLALVLTAAALAGEPFTMVMGIGLLVLLILCGLTASRSRAILRLGAAGVVALLLASPALLPALHQLSESLRAEGVKETGDVYGSVHPIRLFTLLVPEALGRQQVRFEFPIRFLGMEFLYLAPILTNLHLGALTVLGVLLALRRRSRAVVVLSATFLGCVLLSLGAYLGVSTLLARWVPGLAVFRYSDKYWFLVTLAAAILVGISLEHLHRRSARVAYGLAVLALGVGWHLGGPLSALLGAVPFVLCGVVLQVLPEKGRPIIVAVLFLDLLVHGLRVNSTLDPEELRREDGIGPVLMTLRPTRIFAHFEEPFIGVERGVEQDLTLTYNALEPNVGIDRGFHYTVGYDPVEPIARLDLYFGLDKSLQGSVVTFLRHRLLRLADTSHSVTNAPIGSDPEVSPMIRGPAGIGAYAYNDPLPRARLYGDSARVEHSVEARRLLHSLPFDPDRFLIVEGDDPPLRNGVPVGSVSYQIDAPERVRLAVTSDRAAWLFLADAWSDGWEATVNGRPVDIRHAHVAFRAVPVPLGESIVEFRYRPAWIRQVLYTFPVGVGLLLLLLVPRSRLMRLPLARRWFAREGNQKPA